MSDALPIQLLNPDPISAEELDAALGSGAANDDAVSADPKMLVFSPAQLDQLLADHTSMVRHALLNTPETKDFLQGVALEAAHQRERWGNDHDSGKTPFDWVFLIGHLATRAAMQFVASNLDKALHHAITTAAACANWHAAMQGQCNVRPGIGAPKEDTHAQH